MARTRFYKIQELADRWWLLPRTVRNMILCGQLKAYKIGRSIRISPEAVQNYEERAVLLRIHEDND